MAAILRTPTATSAKELNSNGHSNFCRQKSKPAVQLGLHPSATEQSERYSQTKYCLLQQGYHSNVVEVWAK